MLWHRIFTSHATGIGKETALDMARRDARVIMACRNTDKAEEAKSNCIIFKLLYAFIRYSQYGVTFPQYTRVT